MIRNQVNAIFLFREKVGWKVAKALKRGDDGISHAAIDMLCALMEPMHQVTNCGREQKTRMTLTTSISSEAV